MRKCRALSERRPATPIAGAIEPYHGPAVAE